MSWFRNAITNLYAAVSAPVATTCDALLKRLGGIREVVTGAYNRIRGHRPQKTLKDVVEEVTYDGVEDVKRLYGRERAKQADEVIEDVRGLFDGGDAEHHDELIEDGNRVKAWRFKKSLDSPLTRTVMVQITPHVDMRVVVVYSFSCEIY